MNLYRTANGVWAGTQLDAKADGPGWKPVDVPTDKPSLLAWLNANVPPASPLSFLRPANAPAEEVMPDLLPPEMVEPSPSIVVEPKAARDMSATATLSRMDGGPDVDRIVDAISVANAHVLKRFAGAVAMAFMNLGGK